MWHKEHMHEDKYESSNYMCVITCIKKKGPLRLYRIIDCSLMHSLAFFEIVKALHNFGEDSPQLRWSVVLPCQIFGHGNPTKSHCCGQTLMRTLLQQCNFIIVLCALSRDCMYLFELPVGSDKP